MNLDSPRDLLTSDELRKAQRKIAELTNRSFSWTNIGNFTAKLMLFVFGAIWFGTFWGMLEPDFGIAFAPLSVVPAQLLYGLLTLFIVLGLSFACTVVPSIFWSSLIAQTPAAELMNKLYAKYGRSGFIVALVGAIVFTKLGFDVFYSFLLTRPHVVEQGPQQVFFWTLICVFLAIVFPAWALNRMTADQWISGMIQAREVARLQHQLKLEDMIGAAMIARMDALLNVDLTQMTFDARDEHNREIAALLATSERRINKALKRIGHTFHSLHGISMDIQTDSDDRIVTGYKRLAELFTEADTVSGEYAGAIENYVATMPEVERVSQPQLAAPAEPPPPSAAERLAAQTARRDAEIALLAQELGRSVTPPATGPTVRMPVSQSQTQTDSGRPSQPPAASARLAAPTKWPDAYLVCRELLTVPFSVHELAITAKVSDRTADRMRKAWLEGHYLTDTDVDGKYFWDDPTEKGSAP